MATRDYREWKLPQLWEMLSGDADSTAVRHLNTWEHQTSMLDQQRTRLRELRADLEARWPPDKSEAAAAFVVRVKDMIQAMDDTVAASSAIRNGLKLVVAAIDTAREEIRPLLDHYDDRTAAWEAFSQRPMPLVGKGLPPLSPTTPGVMDRVLASHRAQLDEQARNSMKSADAKVTEANRQIKTVLPAYGRFLESEPIPSPSRPGGSTGSARSGSTLMPVVPAPIFDPPAPPRADDGPALAGNQPLPAGLGTVPSSGPGPSSFGTNGSGVAPPPGIGSWGTRTGSGQRVMPPGGVIGEPVAGRTAVPYAGGMMGGVAPSGRPRTRVAAPQHPAMGRVLGELRDGSAQPLTGTSGWRDSQYDEYVRRRRHPAEADPDNPWAVQEGVPPVLDAADEPIHTPGPGVIGLDR